MGTPILGTNVASAVVPFTTDDDYATHDSKYGKGGWREVASTTERDAIPAARRTAGMIVNVVGDTAYTLDSDLVSWTPFASGGGADSNLTSMTAAVNLNGNFAVKVNSSGLADVPSITLLADGQAVVGITTGAISMGASGDIRTAGTMTEPSWTWTPGLPVYVADLGALTQSVPTGKWVLQIGVAETATQLVINVGLVVSTPL